MESDVLHDLLFLVNIAFGNGNVLVGLEIEFGGIGIAAANAFAGACIGLDINDVANADTLFLHGFVD